MTDSLRNDYTHETLRALANDSSDEPMALRKQYAIDAHADAWGAQLAASQEQVRELDAKLRAEKAREEAPWWPKPWPREFDGPVLAYAKSADPRHPLVHQAWWDGEKLSLLPEVWIYAVTHIRQMPEPPGEEARDE